MRSPGLYATLRFADCYGVIRCASSRLSRRVPSLMFHVTLPNFSLRRVDDHAEADKASGRDVGQRLDHVALAVNYQKRIDHDEHDAKFRRTKFHKADVNLFRR